MHSGHAGCHVTGQAHEIHLCHGREGQLPSSVSDKGNELFWCCFANVNGSPARVKSSYGLSALKWHIRVNALDMK